MLKLTAPRNYHTFYISAILPCLINHLSQLDYIIQGREIVESHLDYFTFYSPEMTPI